MNEPITGSAGIVVGLLSWHEARKLRMLLEANAKALPAVVKPALVVKPRRKSRPREGRTSDAAALAAVELRRQKLTLEREKHEWRKNRDVAKAIGWLVDRIGEDEYDDEE